MIPSNRKPTHPGIVLERDFMKPMGITPAQLAEKLGGKWSEVKITSIINGQEGISEKSAQDLAAFFGTTADFWNHLQQQYFQWARVRREMDKGPLKQMKKAQ
ncbi:MAG: HigA family addiction module antidote protein [Verrucomicrobia bacterium]|nr:HigA family addiction module antidote protein [Verrucomicrobiota bacterium]